MKPTLIQRIVERRAGSQMDVLAPLVSCLEAQMLLPRVRRKVRKLGGSLAFGALAPDAPVCIDAGPATGRDASVLDVHFAEILSITFLIEILSITFVAT